MNDDILDVIKLLCEKIEPVGSRVTCNPAPTDTDQDYLVLVKGSKLYKLFEILKIRDYTCGGSCPNNFEDSDGGFQSFKNKSGDINYIITTSKVFFKRFMAASSVAKRFNLLKKDDRITLFDAVLYGNECCVPENKQVSVDYMTITKEICG